MKQMNSRGIGPWRRRGGRVACAAVLTIGALASGALAAPPPAAAAGAGGSSLSPRLAELSRPGLRSAPAGERGRRLALPPRGPGSLLSDGDRVVVRVRFERGAVARLDALRRAGARVVSFSRPLQTVVVAVAPAALSALAATPGVRAVTETFEPLLLGGCEGGAVISEGLAQLRVDAAREQFGVRGKGITVGVLSDSFDTATEAAAGGPIATHAQQDVQSNDLPGPAGTCSGQQAPVDVLEELAGEGSDEGRAMLQIIHDLAPHAGLAFATAFESEESFAQNIERLAQPEAEGGAGAEVIVDDVAWFEEPFFQDGPVAAAINRVTAEGVPYLTAVGNSNVLLGGMEIASWEAPAYRPAACPAPLLGLPADCLDFDPGARTDTGFGLTLKANARLLVDLQWGEPWNGVEGDLDVYLVREKTGEVVAGGADDNIASQRPVELLSWQNPAPTAESVRLMVNRCAATCNPAASSSTQPRLKFVLMPDGGAITATEYSESGGGDVVGPTVFGHAGAESAISVAAVPFNNSGVVASYSSRGPVVHLFEPVEGAEPAAPLPGAPQTIPKPDLAATDCSATTFFAQLVSGVWRFCGTSAAAPHAAAVAALIRQAVPSASPQQIREALALAADPVAGFPPEAAGAGLLDALGALEVIGATPVEDDGPSTPLPPAEEGGTTPPPAPVPAPGSFAPIPVQPAPPSAAPSTFFRQRPPKLVRTRRTRARVVFRFGSDQAGAAFLCRVDRSRFRRCPPRFVRRLGAGPHVVRVKARGAGGRVDRTPAVYRFRVKRIR